ncbi:uncharacterized protein K460DRAFT_413841 [Cucurbitaria berberidis CBS 394.84]|uniref:Uncharacterized protein n=1 Tax=Cucurbitaria berberidis CBS 394.84 TaxID=1168544 RepID=A0A9P4GIX7_9PLEO|nr:uncharacterized protein K460DRAFT_413841 [Cucurbitaria berberidis CBS 394.84]KAF1847033.1 hypothetical protein K460DRAFT_413841 [Cucurbitaria berberidis CBS 394.84]
MSHLKKSKRKSTPPGTQSPTSQRPQSFSQRLSSGFSSMITNLPRRKSTPKHDPTQRSTTAPNPFRPGTQGRAIGSSGLLGSQHKLIPGIDIPTLADADSPCPYDPSSYHSFPSIEQSRYDFCGLKPPLRPTSGIPPSCRPCSKCRSKSPFAHIACGRKPSRNENRTNPAIWSSPAQLREASLSPEEGPRLVPAAVAARRIGNPPRRAPLPVPRLPAARNPRPTYNSHGPHSVEQGPVITGTAVIVSNIRDDRDLKVRSASPRLHHIHGLPNAKDYPYVHKREVEGHLAALRAGSPSPLRLRVDRPSSANTLPAVADYSETVFYGRPISSASARHSDVQRSLFPSQPQLTTLTIQRVEATGRVVVGNTRRERPTSLNMELENNEVYRRRSPPPRTQAGYYRPTRSIPQPSESQSTSSSPETSATPKVGGRRLELKGGSQSTASRLRGGSAGKRSPEQNCGFKLKTWLLTGSCLSHSSDVDSDADLPPSRTPDPASVVRASKRACGRVPLPAHISRGGHGATSLQLATVLGTDSHNHALPHMSYLRRPPLFRKHADSLINKPGISKSPSLNNLSPHLRGGAGSSSCLLDTDRLPPTLCWLAGGRGKRPYTVASWKKGRPKKRAGGLLGMAMYGVRAGMDYAKEGDGGDQVTAAGESKAGSVKEGTDGMESVEDSSKSPASHLSSSSSSGSARAMHSPSASNVAPAAQNEDAKSDIAPEANNIV